MSPVRVRRSRAQAPAGLIVLLVIIVIAILVAWITERTSQAVFEIVQLAENHAQAIKIAALSG